MTDCIFCKIVNGEIPSNIVYQDTDFVAFRDIAPAAPTHILVVPRKHVVDIGEAVKTDEPLVSTMLLIATQIAASEKVDASGYRLVINTGKDGGQSVFHLHVHLLAGRAMTWPPG
ncbi:MAG: histidine triad nucleotide-binding protein [Aggregatilineales bacterium]